SELDNILKTNDEYKLISQDNIDDFQNKILRTLKDYKQINNFFYCDKLIQMGNNKSNEYNVVDYKNKKYVVGKVKYKDSYKLFIIDYDDFDKIKNIGWMLVNKYIGSELR